jgi:Zn-dependent peptidase ImmA (M78 family)
MTAHFPTTRFAGNYVVRVKMRAPSTLKKRVGDSYGYWDVDTRTIFIDKTASVQKQEYTYTHEMDHAFNDWRHQYLREDLDESAGCPRCHRPLPRNRAAKLGRV